MSDIPTAVSQPTLVPRFARRATSTIAVTLSTMLLLAGCTFDFDIFGRADDTDADSSSLAATGTVTEEEVAPPEPSFRNGAVKAWTLPAKELFPAGVDDYADFDVATHYRMVKSAGPLLLFGDYHETRALDPRTQSVVWEHPDIGPVGRCALDDDEEVLYCPILSNSGRLSSSVMAVQVATGKKNEIHFKGLDGSELKGVEDIEVAGDSLLIYQADNLQRVDLSGNVLWQQPVRTNWSENRFFTVNSSSVLVTEASASLDSIFDLETGQVIFSGDSASAPAFDMPVSYYGNIRGSTRFAWDTGSIFEGNERQVYAVDGAVLYSHEDCIEDSGPCAVTAFDVDTGTPLWDMDIEGRILEDGSRQYLTTVTGVERVGSHGVITFDSITIYGPTMPGESSDSYPVTANPTVQASTDTPEGIPSCPGSTLLLSWAELPNGWILVCGISETEPTYWASQFSTAEPFTTSDVSYISVSGSPGYQATLPSGSILQLGSDSDSVQVVRNMGDVVDSSGSAADSLTVLLIYFVNLGTKQPGTTTSSPSPGTVATTPENSTNTTAPNRAPSSTANAPSEPAPSSAFCPAGSTPYFEGETDGFFISICRNNSGGFTYVGYSPTLGEMLLPTEDLGTHWRAANESHAYLVNDTHLDVYELADNENILHDPFTWTRQY